MRWVSFLVCPLVLFASISNDLNIGLRALQQMRTLIPERLSEEEFAIVVDQSAFAKMVAAHSSKEPEIRRAQTFACSQIYYSHWTLSGENVRILDSYQEFEYGPYWLYPTAMHRLYEMYPK